MNNKKKPVLIHETQKKIDQKWGETYVFAGKKKL
jgi:hypothetical protein